MITIKNLSLSELLEKVRILVGATKATSEDRFILNADWDESGMTISIKPHQQKEE